MKIEELFPGAYTIVAYDIPIKQLDDHIYSRSIKVDDIKNIECEMGESFADQIISCILSDAELLEFSCYVRSKYPQVVADLIEAEESQFFDISEIEEYLNDINNTAFLETFSEFVENKPILKAQLNQVIYQLLEYYE